MKKRIVLGIVAHVDAGKTTLSEAMLFESGAVRKLGRVDRRDCFLDNNTPERERGITVFSKQALISLDNTDITLLDTPGHVDFACEAERAIQVMDYALLIISGTDGVQPHTATVWKLLEKYTVPALIFVSKMDLPGPGHGDIFNGLVKELSDNCVDFSDSDDLLERIAMCDDAATEEYLETMTLPDSRVGELIASRKLFPCFFGSGLKNEGVTELLSAVDKYLPEPVRQEEFCGRVYKIARDAKGSRMTFLKLTGGALNVKGTVSYKSSDGEEYSEKVNEIRLYSGPSYTQIDRAEAGQLVALTGLGRTYPGMGIGADELALPPVIEPVMSYRITFPDGENPQLMLPLVKQLEEEDPQLHVVWNSSSKEIELRLMGKVQTEILAGLMEERFGHRIQTDSGRIMYRETIAERVEGIGHFEPLRHYAEVHLIIEPLPEGSGIVADSICSEDSLDRNWQRLIFTHIFEKPHIGVLTGSPLTDVKITLAAGKAHVKHTEGGDFRQATYRAIRQGLMKARSVLLEPYYAFSVTVPSEQAGKVINDIKSMHGEFTGPEGDGITAVIQGTAPVSEMSSYPEELVSFTHGKGRISLRPDGYRPCRRQDELVAEIGYNPEADADNTPDSVFCSHGAGMNVSWNKVEEFMHLESCLKPDKQQTVTAGRRTLSIDERELEEIMTREFGPIRRAQYTSTRRNEAPSQRTVPEGRREHLIIDGYNVIFAWDSLKELAEGSLDLARTALMDLMANYAAFRGTETVLVFDGFRTPGNPGSRSVRNGVDIVFTKDGETADAYIEKLAGDIGKNYNVRVVTTDSLIRLSALRSGVLRTASKDFETEVRDTLERMREYTE